MDDLTLSPQRPTPDQERHTRRLSDKVKLAFEQACDDGELVTAAELLAILELVLLRNPPAAEYRDNVLGALYACQARLFNLKRGATRRPVAPPPTPEQHSGVGLQ